MLFIRPKAKTFEVLLIDPGGLRIKLSIDNAVDKQVVAQPLEIETAYTAA